MTEKIIDIFNITSKSIEQSYTRVFRKITASLKKMFNIKAHSSKLIREARKKIKAIITGKKKSVLDYLQLGNVLISKKLLAIVLIICISVPFLYFRFAVPFLRGRFWTPTFYFNSADIEGYTGKAKILSSNSRVVYYGEISDGKCTGSGKLYDLGSNLVYAGEFLLNDYSGKGELYNNEQLKYKGDFLLNTYNGEGQLFFDNGVLNYQGSFKDGVFNGTGTEYHADGTIKYQGGFKDGKYNNEGTLYQNGQIKYSGGFKEGNFHDKGTLYDNYGNKTYSGFFEDNRYNGEGTEYYPDGNIKYMGLFKSGKYNGQGTLYHDIYKNILYQGTFLEGLYNGTGKLFDPGSQRLLYEGGFKDNLYDGTGSLYSKNGRMLYNGPFKNGTIDFPFLLGLPASDLENNFLTEPVTDVQDNLICLTYDELAATLVLETDPMAGSSLDENIAKVTEIVLWGDQKTSGLDTANTADDFSKILGEPLYSGYTYLTFTDELALRSQLQAGNKTNTHLGEIFMAHFNTDEYGLSAFFESSDGEFLYLIISGI